MVIDQFVAWHSTEHGQTGVGSLDVYRSARVRELFKVADFEKVGRVDHKQLSAASAPPAALRKRITMMRTKAEVDGGFVSAASWEAAFAQKLVNGDSLSELSDKEHPTSPHLSSGTCLPKTVLTLVSR